MKPPRRTDNLTPDSIRTHLEQVNKVLGGNVSFGTTTANTDRGRNINGWAATVVTPGAPDTEFAVPHGLGRIPIGFLVMSRSVSGNVYKSTTAWTTTNIYLKDSAVSDTLVLFIV